jgi:hypothetical protein
MVKLLSLWAWWRVLGALACLAPGLGVAGAAAPQPPAALAAAFATDVDRKLDIPSDELRRYTQRTEAALARAGIVPPVAQYLVVVDRDPWVQALLLLHRTEYAQYRLIGAAPVSTGRPGGVGHFETPLGVFEHRAEGDFRADGTPDENGILGYGDKGMRVFDFGWQAAAADGRTVQMRLLMHATDPQALEPRLGNAQSDGGIRIPATLDRLLDRYGVLDAPDAGRYLVVVDSGRSGRPEWSPAPYLPHRRVTPPAAAPTRPQFPLHPR